MSITALNDYAIGDIDLTAIVETLDKTYKGKAEITLSEYDTTSAPDVKVGSVFENNGALFIVDTSDITPTGYSGISNSTTFYLYYDESAGAFIYSSTAPTWSDALQGHYNGNDRAFFSMYKDSGGTLYENKQKLVYLKNTVRKITSSNYLHGTMTGGTVFTKLDPFIPNVGDRIIINGEYSFSSASYIVCSFAYRSSSTEIEITGGTGNISGVNFLSADSGSATSYKVSITW